MSEVTGPTAAEVYRRLDDIATAVHRIEERMVPRPEYEAHVRESDRRLSALEATKTSAHQEIHAKIATTRADLDARISRVSDENDARENDRQRWAREIGARSWLTVAGAGLGVIGALLAALLT